MNNKNSNSYLGLIAAALSMLLLFTPWMSLDAKGVKDKETLNYIKEYLEEGAEDALEDVVDSAEYYGLTINRKDLNKSVKAISDLKLSASESNHLAKTFGSFLGKLINAFKKEAKEWNYDITQATEYKTVQSIRGALNAYHILYILHWISFFALVASIVIDKYKGLRIPFLVTKVILFIVTLTLTSRLNETISSFTNSLYYYFYDTSSFKVNVSVTFWAILSLLLAIPSILDLSGVKIGNNAKLSSAVAAAGDLVKTGMDKIPTEAITQKVSSVTKSVSQTLKGNDWICPECGNRNKEDASFCFSCGKAKPGVIKCKNCGKILKPGAKFCPDCGTAVEPVQEKTDESQKEE